MNFIFSLLLTFIIMFSPDLPAIKKLEEKNNNYSAHFDKAAPYSATCKIFGNGGYGTGTLITDDHGHLGVITAAHVAHNLKIANQNGDTIIYTQKEVDEQVPFPAGSYIDIQTYSVEENLQSFVVFPSEVVYLVSPYRARKHQRHCHSFIQRPYVKSLIGKVT